MDHRASDGEREAAADHVRDAAGEGRLTVEELDERLTRVYGATTRGELEHVTSDLPAATAPRASAEGEGSRWVISIMGASDRLGRWRVARRCTVVNLMGGADLDFTQAELVAGEAQVRIISIMGGSGVWVPDHLDVEVSSFAFMGGNSDKRSGSAAPPGAPRLRLRLISIMGGTEVKRGPKRSLRQRLHRLHG